MRRPIIAEPSNVVVFVKATIALHNYSRTEESSIYCPTGFIDGEDGSGNIITGAWRDDNQATELRPVSALGGNRCVKILLLDIQIIIKNLFYTFSSTLGTQDLHLKIGNPLQIIFAAILAKYNGNMPTSAILLNYNITYLSVFCFIDVIIILTNIFLGNSVLNLVLHNKMKV